MNTALDKTNTLAQSKIYLLINPKYLKDLNKQEEDKLLKDRTLFLEFHRYIYALSDEEIIKLFKANKVFRFDGYKVFSKEYVIDFSIVFETVMFHFALRDKKDGAIPQFCDECAKDYLFTKSLAEDFPEITSQHLIGLTKDIIKNYKGEEKFVFS